ncbi:hypothetical protein [Romboutsia lituseburensis]|uniref:Lipoprotein n=1 Tax=Romboutsia lituseburensis DSM 797 TaxID=1121325 RepID=A0A1G9TXT1_9FIRM|nr:hypothetical protein [Romboutsia lituseburensis]CEH34700.1 Prokaryotic membrane lipoprotein lipid attachment site profile [Romboutsia lituseburensis]SDM52433.1 hypothetical protein SAMN04515677_1149 [Romboutsia lituseburensis DSM 797]
MKKTIILLITTLLLLIAVGCNSRDNKSNYNYTWDYETEEYKNMNVSDLISLRDKLIDDELKGLSKSDYEQQKKEILGNNNYQLVGFVNCLYTAMPEKDKLIKQIKLIKYLDSLDSGIDPAGEFIYQTNMNYQLNEFFTINNLWTEENKEKQCFDPTILVDNFEKIYEYTDLNKYLVFELIRSSYGDYTGKSISLEKEIFLLNELKNINDKKSDNRLVDEDYEKNLFLSHLRSMKTEFESKLKEEKLSQIEKENIKSNIELINNLIKN